MLDVERLIWAALNQPEKWLWDEKRAYFDKPPAGSGPYEEAAPAHFVLDISRGWVFLRLIAINGRSVIYDLDFIARFFMWRKIRRMQTKRVVLDILLARMVKRDVDQPMQGVATLTTNAPSAFSVVFSPATRNSSVFFNEVDIP